MVTPFASGGSGAGGGDAGATITTGGSGTGGGGTTTACAFSVTAGQSHTCAHLTPSGVACWGRNTQGEIGDGTTGGRGCGSSDGCVAPEVIPVLGSDTVQIAEGLDAHGCARKLDGSVWCWGDNLHGEVGDGAIDGPKCFLGWPCQATPLEVGGIGGPTEDVAVGLGFSVAVRQDGTAFFWGDDTWGVRGDGTLGGDQPAPVAVAMLGSSVAQVSAGHEHVCARKIDGTVWCWGRNEGGQLGDGTADGIPCLGWKCRPAPVPVAGLDQVVKIAAGGFHTCAIRTGPTLWCWGDNSGGQLGVGQSPVTAVAPVQVPLPGSVTDVAAGHLHTCARLSDGTLWCWGYNGTGQVGDGTTDDRFMPVQIDTAGAAVSSVSAGDSHTCARTADGTLLCWGARVYQQAGDGVGPQLTPGPVPLPCP